MPAVRCNRPAPTTTAICTRAANGTRISELYHYRARMYDSYSGRFLSRDPIGYVDGRSLYRAYFPTNDVDPSGLKDVVASTSEGQWVYQWEEGDARSGLPVPPYDNKCYYYSYYGPVWIACPPGGNEYPQNEQSNLPFSSSIFNSGHTFTISAVKAKPKGFIDVEVKLALTGAWKQCCTEFKLIQIARHTSTGWTWHIDGANNPNGTSVDPPFYDGNGFEFDWNGETKPGAIVGTSATPAILYDQPGLHPGNFTFQAITCGFCTNGPKQGQWIGCYEWWLKKSGLTGGTYNISLPSDQSGLVPDIVLESVLPY